MTMPSRFTAVTVTLCLAAGTTACRDAPAPAAREAAALQGPATASSGEESPVGIGTARVVSRADRIQAVGTLALDESRTSRIGATVEGTVVEMNAQVGDRVGRGSLLARIHSHAIHDAWAAQRKAAADARRQESELAFAREGEARAGRLLAAGALSPREAARARVDRIAAEEHLEMARAEVRRAEEDLELLGFPRAPGGGAASEQMPVRSPIGGIVLERLVSPGFAVTPGAPLFVVSDLSQLWVVAEVDESRLRDLAVGRSADLIVAAYPDERFPMTTTFIGHTVNPETRRVTVRGVVANPQGRLKPEMYATVSLALGEPRQVVVVPSAAVQELAGRRVVFLAQPDGTFAERAVVTGLDTGGEVEIREGLEGGDRIAVKGSFLLKSQLLNAAGPEN